MTTPPIPAAVVVENPRNNNFNLLRLVLASLVLLSHSSELVDGNRNREILTQIFHSLSFGELAVDGFFILSGYLIVQSWNNKPQAIDFLRKRILRIYPGFLVATLVSVFVFGPLGASQPGFLAGLNPRVLTINAALLQPPVVPPVFGSHPSPLLNGAMWTISYEFRCYLLVLLLGILGLGKSRLVWPAFLIASMTLFLQTRQFLRWPSHKMVVWAGDPMVTVRFLAFFAAGACFYIYRYRIPYKGKFALAAFALWVVSMFNLNTAQIGVATVGAYALFWLAFAKIPALDRFKGRNDISYGLYLYGWPIQKLLLWYIPGLQPWFLFPLSLALSALCGWVSWKLIERPCLRFKPAT